jgi:DNA-binding SARP family transcriptional activator
MRARVLGPIELWSGDRRLAVGAPKQRAVLALLLMRANAVVPVDEIIDELWPGAPPASALPNVRTYAASLRRTLADVSGVSIVISRSVGYSMAIDASEFDVSCFRDSVRLGRAGAARGDARTAVLEFNRGLGLWRGRALADVPVGAALAAWRTALEEERLRALEDRAEAFLAVGSLDEAAGDARQVLAAEPLREHAHALLVRASYQSGDVAGALAAFETARHQLAEELGLDPGEELRRLHRAVLDRDTALGPPRTSIMLSHRVSAGVVPRQLPADLPVFSGRADDLRRLTSLIHSGEHARSTAAIAMTGAAGAGKTTLAVHWAHQIRDLFPDGQLFVNLRGFDPAGSPMTPDAATYGFLEALGVSSQHIPLTFEARTGLYRTLLATRRVLVVLDNARSAEQVRPLLPGGSSCLAIVTSRVDLSGLVAVEGAFPFPVDLPGFADARQLLSRRLGRQRVEAEPQAVDEMVTRCARLPLALAVVSARAASRPSVPLATIVSELCSVRTDLDAFADADPAADGREVFSWSYRNLSGGAARMFRLLGTQPGPDIGSAAAASLAGLSRPLARSLLAELTRVHLINESGSGRYTLHDLLRAYAVELVRLQDSEQERRDAVRRVLSHYVHSAYGAAKLLDPHLEPMVLSPVRPGVSPEQHDGYDQALAWFAEERTVLLASLAAAAESGFDTEAWQLAYALTEFLDLRDRHQQVIVQRTGLAAACRAADDLGRVHTHRSLARAYVRLGDLAEASDHYRQALELLTASGDRVGQARIHRGLGWVSELQGDCAEAVRHSERALAIYQAAGHRTGQANALNAVGWLRARLGDHQGGLELCMQALAVHQQIAADPNGQANTLDSLGSICHLLGDHRRAAAFYRDAIDLYRNLGDPYNEADSLVSLGKTHQAGGEDDSARQAWEQALKILDDLDHPDADEVRTYLP